MIRSRWLAPFVVLACGLLAGCMTAITIQVPAPQDAPGTSGFRAGAHRIDITPIPGIPMAGYSIDGKPARGFWTRLQARALYLEDSSGTPLVLVSTDLSAIPGGLGDEVVRRLHETHGLVHIGREHVLASATHTHHGPGNYYTDRMFNQTVSPYGNFHQALFDFLAERIAKAIANAHAAAAPAELLTTDPASMDMAPAAPPEQRWKLERFLRNRSLPAFLLNARAADALDNEVPDDCKLYPHDEPDSRACLAVRPQVELLAFQHGGATEIGGVAAFVAVHPTVLPQRNELYSGDLFGVASTKLEELAECSLLTGDTVVAFLNGAEGDVSPAWVDRDRKEVLQLGETLASKVCDLAAGLKTVASPSISFRYARVLIAGGEFAEERPFWDETGSRVEVTERRVGERALPGAASAGGAEDGRSIFHELLGHREGYQRIARRHHGPKSPVGFVEGMGLDLDLLKLNYWLNPPPEEAPIAVYRIGATAPNVVIASVPGELTTQMGRRLRESLWNALTPPRPAKADHILLVGNANEYLGYFTTPEEYEAQHYEGAMTLRGPASGPFLAEQVAALGKSFPSSSAARSWSNEYDPGPRFVFEPKYVWGPPFYEDDGFDFLTRDLGSGRVRRDLPVFCWRDAVPRLEDVDADCLRTNPDVAVQTKIVLGAGTFWPSITTNRALDLLTYVTAVGRDANGLQRTDWCALWLGAPLYIEPARTQDYRFHVAGFEGPDRVSRVFGNVDSDGDTWIDERFLQRPASRLVPQFGGGSPDGHCRVPGP